MCSNIKFSLRILEKGFVVELLSNYSRTFTIIRQKRQKFEDYCFLECGATKSGTFVQTYLGILPPPSSEYPDTSETSALYCVTSHKAAICIVATQKYVHLTEILLFNWHHLCRFHCT